MRLAKQVEESGHNRSWIERISATAIGRAWGIDLNASNGSGLPSFFVIGPPRTGTTWLYEILRLNFLFKTHVSGSMSERPGLKSV
jgi:hypothetical protein